MTRAVTVADLARDPAEVARELAAWQRGDVAEAVAETLDLSGRDLHGRVHTLWVWTGRTPGGEPVWATPVTAGAARDFAPRGPARALARLTGVAVQAGADPGAVWLADWLGHACLVLPGVDEELAPAAVAEAAAAPARAVAAELPPGVAVGGPAIPLAAVAGADSGVSRLARETHVHPVRVVLALAAHGQPVDDDRYPPELVPALREWGCDGEPPPPAPPSYAVDDDACPRRRHARVVLRRLFRMKKIGSEHHTEFDHLYRGLAASDRRDGLAVGEALIRAGLLGEKPSVGQRHVYLRPEELPAIHALIDRGETRDAALAAEWTAPAPGDAPGR